MCVVFQALFFDSRGCALIFLQHFPVIARGEFCSELVYNSECFSRTQFADHITALPESLHSELADVGNPLIRQLGRYLR